LDDESLLAFEVSSRWETLQLVDVRGHALSGYVVSILKVLNVLVSRLRGA
jgi:hypothetical protein